MTTQHPILVSAVGAVLTSVFSVFLCSSCPSDLSSKGETEAAAGSGGVDWCIGLMLLASSSFPCERVSTQSGFGLEVLEFFVFSSTEKEE
jgi:hypothetical protein